MNFADPMTAINEVAPPGGWVVFVNCMARIAKDTASGAASKESGPKNEKVLTPTNAEIICPPNKFLG